MSDLHLSLFEEVERFQELKEFCSINLLAIKPKIVIISGDLTEAISPNKFHAQQYEGEWKMYDEFRRRCQSKFDVEWLDLRGNHGYVSATFTHSHLFDSLYLQIISIWRTPIVPITISRSMVFKAKEILDLTSQQLQWPTAQDMLSLLSMPHWMWVLDGCWISVWMQLRLYLTLMILILQWESLLIVITRVLFFISFNLSL